MGTLLIKNVTVIPVTTETKRNHDVLIENGIIKEIAENVTPPLSVSVIDGTGQYLLPGFIDVHTHLGLYDEGTGWAGNDANETVEPITPHIRAKDGVYPLDPAFADAIRYGITTAHVMPGSANVIGGTTSVIKTAGKHIDKMIIKDIAGLKIALGENPKRMHSAGNKLGWGLWGCFGKLFTRH